MKRGTLTTLCALLVALSAASPARAQLRVDDAQAFFREGTAAYEAHDYRRALDVFERVFALRGNPDLLFNVYLCHRAMGDPEQAARALRRFLVARPEHPEHARLSATLAQLDADASALATRRAPQPTVTAPTAPTVVGVAPPVLPPPTRGSGPGAGPWVLLGTGIAAAGVGAALMLTASVDDAANARSERARADLLDGASAQHTAGAVVLGVGAAAALGGVLWRVLAPGAAPSVSVRPGGVAMSFTARWP